ncbi:outer membrane beta-barrel family protein [Paenimyroides aestuarii]|uniref:Outer membrane beta-barrel family protein n=1 Tax=Paenimyroides aestuarii TaxID=2968490 RepID=A0ABY5NW15_9FLAO|nr:outer membrane beta-barrel family protein [Paenimyroides aestuarii]UUV22557.1 outer membrane beta-barrel family protein [Paenimyroides aestuarii]
MKKIQSILFLVFLLLSIHSFAQNIQLKGKVTNEKKEPITDLTVYLSKVKDSTLIQYATTDALGSFAMDLKAVEEPSFLTFSIIGFKDKIEKFDQLNQSKDLGEIVMTTDSDLLSEIVIVTDAPIRVKNDTLEFNASSFKVRPDANVEALLKELPGVEIDANKKITVNGKEVSQILVNGKPFFNTDGSIALQNLPADLIKKVQVTDFKTKSEEFSGRKAKSDNASINLTIDDDKNKGLMAKLSAGIGSIIDDSNRYESSGLINYFQGNRKISVLASSNNINSEGFSMDELFDNMGGGRSQFLSFGSRSGGPFGFGSGTGITRTHMAGFNYSDQFFEDLETNASYYFKDTQNKNNNRSRVINLLPDGDFITESVSQRLNNNTNHNADLRLEYKLNPSTKIFVSPVITANTNELASNSTSASTDGEGNLLNENTEKSFSTTDSFTFKNAIEFNKKFNDKGKNLSVTLENDHSKTTGLGNTNSATLFYQDERPNDIRNQEEQSRSTDDIYTITTEYSQPISEKAFIDFGYTFEHNNQTDRLNTFNFNESTNTFTDFNDRLSNETNTNIVTNTPYVGMNFNSDKIDWFVNSGVNIANFNASAFYMNNNYSVDRKFVAPYIRSNFRYKLDKSKNFNVGYNYNVNNPNATQILPYERLNDPLQTFIGNENLDQVRYHSLRLGFRNYNFQLRSGWSVFLNGSYYDSQIVSFTLFDENRKRTTTYENVAGAFNANLFFHWNKSHKFNEHTIRYGTGTRLSLDKQKGFANGVLYDANGFTFTPNIYGSWDYGELFTLAPSYNVSFNNTKYTNFQLQETSFVRHNLMLQTTTYWPENFTWGNDFSYTYNSNIAPGFQRDFFLWNTAISYAFLNKALTAKVKVYDVLNQNIGTSRTISPTAIIDQENTVLERYVMFSVTWKFNKFANSRNNKNRGSSHIMPGRMREL